MRPHLSDLDRMRARAKALRARTLRADAKKALRSSQLTLGQFFEQLQRDDEESAALSRLRIGEVLLAVPGIGEARADRALQKAGVSGLRRVTALGVRQRERLSRELAPYLGAEQLRGLASRLAGDPEEGPRA